MLSWARARHFVANFRCGWRRLKRSAYKTALNNCRCCTLCSTWVAFKNVTVSIVIYDSDVTVVEVENICGGSSCSCGRTGCRPIIEIVPICRSSSSIMIMIMSICLLPFRGSLERLTMNCKRSTGRFLWRHEMLLSGRRMMVLLTTDSIGALDANASLLHVASVGLKPAMAICD